MMTSAVQEPINLDETPEMNGSEIDPISYMQSFNNVAMRQIFSYLNTKDIAIASKVCTSWNTVSKDKIFWRKVNLKGIKILDWNILIDTINRQESAILNTRCMLMPLELQDLNNFWTNFIFAIKRATQLRQLKLYRCPNNVVEECIIALPQISIFNASSIINFNIGTDINGFKFINLSSVSQMVNLTKLKLKARPGNKLEVSPTLIAFENLTKLRTLSLTSIKLFPLNICRSLDTVTTSLEHLEIGDCKSIPNDLPVSLKRFTNLKILRLENCFDKEKEFSKELLVAIRSLKKLKILELVNIEITQHILEELGKLTGLKSLLIIPIYVNDTAEIINHLINSIGQLSKTLEFLVWGLTTELLHISDLLINQHLHIQYMHGIRQEISLTRNPFDYILLFNEPLNYELDNLIIFSVVEFQQLLKIIMAKTKSTVIKIPFEETTQVYTRKYFKEIKYV